VKAKIDSALPVAKNQLQRHHQGNYQANVRLQSFLATLKRELGHHIIPGVSHVPQHRTCMDGRLVDVSVVTPRPVISVPERSGDNMQATGRWLRNAFSMETGNDRNP